jgi:hypothetical protein
MSNQQKHNDFSHSMTDLMASLAVVFLLVAAAAILMIYQSTKAKVDIQKGRVEAAHQALLKEVVRLFDLKQSDFGLVDDSKCVRVDAANLYSIKIAFESDDVRCAKKSISFRQGEFVFSNSDVVPFIQTSVKQIFTSVCDPKNEYQSLVENIKITGHSDPVRLPNQGVFFGCTGTGGPFSIGSGRKGVKRKKVVGDSGSKSDGLCNNISLSSRRAERVFFVVREALAPSGMNPDEIKIERCVDKLFMVSGRGPTDFEIPLDAENAEEREKFSAQENSQRWEGENGKYGKSVEFPKTFGRNRNITLSIDFKGADL